MAKQELKVALADKDPDFNAHASIRIHGMGEMSISFRRTIRVPDNSKTSELPKEAVLAIAPGGLMRQTIRPDLYPSSVWEKDNVLRLHVNILNSHQFQQVTGLAAPQEPQLAAEYNCTRSSILQTR